MSAMTFNLLGNGPATILPNSILPAGTYQVQYEKQMYPLCIRGYVPNKERLFEAIFCIKENA